MSNIDMSGGVGKEELLAALETVAAFAAAEGADVQAFEQALLVCSRCCVRAVFVVLTALFVNAQELGRLCADQHEFSARNKDVVQSKRGVHTLIDCLKKCEQNRTRAKVVEALRAVCRNHVGNRDLFEPDGMEALGSILQEQAEDLRLTTRVLRLIHTVCAKDENNKVGCMRQIGPELLVQLVGQRKSASVVRHSCLVMRAVTNPDDMRREASCAMENGRALVSRGAIPLLISVARESLERAVAGVTATGADAPAAEAESKQQDEGIPFDNETDGTKPTDVASAAFLALRQLAITSESVNLISAHGGLDLPKLILDSDIDDGLTIRAVIGLVRNICADDKYKTTLCQDGMRPHTYALCSAMVARHFVSDPCVDSLSQAPCTRSCAPQWQSSTTPPPWSTPLPRWQRWPFEAPRTCRPSSDLVALTSSSTE